MALTSKITLSKTRPRPVASLPASEPKRLEQELRILHDQLNKIVDAIEELRKHV